MGKTIDIPNKKINYSPQFRNLIPGEGVDFSPVDKRVDEVSAFIVKTPSVTMDIMNLLFRMNLIHALH